MQYSFEYPYFLLLLIILPYIILYIKKPISIYFPRPNWFGMKSKILSLNQTILGGIYFFLILSLASPISYSSILPSDKSGRDIIFCIDSSGSMVESGFDKNNKIISKYDVVINIINKFINTRYSDNLGISLFGSFAFLASPITYDISTLKQLLNNTSANIAGQNTAIGEGMLVSINGFKFSKAKNKVIILLTDGYHNSGTISPKEAVQLAKKENIKIYTIGIGSNGGYDKNILQIISSQTNGKSFSATNSLELSKVFNELDKLEPSKIRSSIYLEKVSYYHYFLGLALLLLGSYIYRNKNVYY
jgi:Ca-activated chloride channel homolog